MSRSIAADPENLPAITALAGMGILTADDGLIDAALSEILALPADAKRARDPARRVDDLLVQHHLAQVSSGHPVIFFLSALPFQGRRAFRGTRGVPFWPFPPSNCAP